MAAGRILKKNEFTLGNDFLYVFAPDDEAGPSLGKNAAGKSAPRKGLAGYCCEKCGFVECYGVSLA
jgi:hypothetical protein